MIFDLSFILFVMGTGMLFETSLFSLWHRSLFSSPVFVYDGLKFSNEEGRVFIGRGILAVVSVVMMKFFYLEFPFTFCELDI